jgi:hypothetical protein
MLAALLVLGGLSYQQAEAGRPRYRPPTLQEQAEYLGNESYFEAHGGNPRDYVIALYADVLDRQPSETEIQRWSERFYSSGNAVVMAREFLIFAQSELANRPPQFDDPPCRHERDRCPRD